MRLGRSAAAAALAASLWPALLALAPACAPASKPPVAPAPPAPAAPAPAASQSDEDAQAERLAAIQHAMNELDEGAQLCWAAAAAVDGYQLAGELSLTIDIARPRSAIAVAKDNLKDPRLLGCMQELLASYVWAAPLLGQAIQLPFAFRAPDGQSVIDRRLVPFAGQGPTAQVAPVSVAVLLDEQNTGNAAASMFEVHLAPGASTQLRVSARTEAWAFLTAATVVDGRGRVQQVAAGDMMLVPRDGVRDVRSSGGEVRAVVVMTPGGEEGSARAGALPTPEAPRGRALTTAPVLRIVHAAEAARYPRPGGEVQLFIDPTPGAGPGATPGSATPAPGKPRTQPGELAASLLTLAAGAAVPSHQHATETELLYILEGAGTVTVGTTSLPVTATSVLQLPPGVPHSFVASAPLRAVQLYTPAGPEQRFKAAAAPRP